jgi:hypothetical protein
MSPFDREEKMIHNGRVSWQNPQVLLTLLTVFLLGTACGGVLVKFGMRPPQVAARSTTWSQGEKKVLFERFQKELNLSPEQSQQMDLVLDDFTMMIQQLQAQTEDVRFQGKERVMRILNDEQKEKFRKFIGEMPR